MSELLAEMISPENLEAYDRLRGDCAILSLTSKVRLFELRGDDRKGWLQGQATNDLKQLDNGASSAFCICSPTGQLLSICEIWGLQDRFLVSCDTACAAAFAGRVEQMVILEDVICRDVTEDFDVYSVQGPNASRALGEHADLPTLDSGTIALSGVEAVVLRSNRTGLGGWDILLPRGSAAPWITTFAPGSDEALEIARIEAGIPRFGIDTDHKTLPPELGPAFEARHISYRKGCYTGQEVLMRIHSRGHTNKTWMGLAAEDAMQVGASVSHGSREDAGVVTSACYSPDYGFIATAMLRKEAAFQGERVVAGGVPAEVKPLPILRFD